MPPLPDAARLGIVAALALSYAAFGLWVSGFGATLDGLLAILTARDTLITDYVALGGIGGAFVNAGALTLLAVLIYAATGAPVGGGALACLLLLLGSALFGKNLLNVWPILAGVLLYCRLVGEPFRDHINTAFFGCALAPVVSEILFSSTLAPLASVPLGVATGILLGLVLPPVAVQLFRLHDGYSLYNMGFVAGVLGSVTVAVLMSYGFVPEPVFIWSADQTARLAPFVLASCAALAVAGLATDRRATAGLAGLLRLLGRAPSDFAALGGDGAALLNMGLLGLFSTGYVLAIGGDLNGPVIAGILSVAGFGAFGKHALNCAPVMAGAVLATLLKGADPADPGILLATLFSTALAPIAGGFGWVWGLLAGALHVSAAQSVSMAQGGLNLYGNGFAAGFVAALVVPLAAAVRAGRRTAADERL